MKISKTILLLNEEQTLIAKLVVYAHSDSLYLLTSDRAIGPEECGRYLDFFRSIPLSRAAVLFELSNRNHVVLLNKGLHSNPPIYTKDDIMNIIDALSSTFDIPPDPDAKERLICPFTDKLPEDGLLEYRVVESISDLINTAPSNTVYMFGSESTSLLQCFVEYHSLFGCQPVVLSGVPSVEYSPTFDNETWSCPRVSYHTVINDLVEAQRRSELVKSEKRDSSIYEKERSGYIRKSGEAKEFKAFDMAKAESMHGSPDLAEPETAEEEH